MAINDLFGALNRWKTPRHIEVYAVTDLLPTTSPCVGTSRWKLLDCSSGCTATPVAGADALATALAQQSGWLRDVAATCSADVPAGIVLQVADSYFQHVHSSEYNVYDFTQ